MIITDEFKKNTSKKVIKDMLANIDDIVTKEIVSDEDELVSDDFDFLATLELEGYYLLPDGEFDFGDTGSNGIKLVDVSPLDTKEGFKRSLIKSLNEILAELQENPIT